MATRAKRDEKGESTLGKKGDRRAFLAAAAGAAVGASAATLLPQGTKRAQAAPGDWLILGAWNDAGEQATSLGASVDGAPETGPNTLQVFNNTEDGAGGGAVNAHARTGAGVIGTTFGIGSGTGVVGTSYFPPEPGVPPQEWETGPQPGVYGGSGSGPGVRGHSQSGPGVEGGTESEAAVGVYGTGPGLGILGESQDGNGVRGIGGNVGVEGIASGAGFGMQGMGENNAGMFGLSQNSSGVMGWTEAVELGPDAILGPFVGGVLGVGPSETPGIRAVSGWHFKGGLTRMAAWPWT